MVAWIVNGFGESLLQETKVEDHSFLGSVVEEVSTDYCFNPIAMTVGVTALTSVVGNSMAHVQTDLFCDVESGHKSPLFSLRRLMAVCEYPTMDILPFITQNI
jgi:hypothetical protein